jgi:peptide/nickel transport system permease protein
MGKYILARLVLLIPVLLGVTLLTFVIARLTPGDPFAAMLGTEATREQIENMRQQAGLNDPMPVQYLRYVWNVSHGDLGLSLQGRTPVAQEILERAGSTLQLTLAAMLLAITLGIGLGTLAAVTRSKLVSSLTMLVALTGLSVPGFWLGILLVLVFGVNLHWVSVLGGEGIKDLILPAFCLGLGPAAVLARLTRSSLLEVLREDHVRTARSKGLAERAVIIRHVLRNALIPVITVIGLQFGVLLGGAVFIESVFARPGLGRFVVNAIGARDYPQIQGVVLFAATAFVLVNLAVDLLYGFIDPRIRVS